MTRGRRGSLALHRMTLSFTTPRRFSPAQQGEPDARGHGQGIRRQSSGGGDPDAGAGSAADPDQAAGRGHEPHGPLARLRRVEADAGDVPDGARRRWGGVVEKLGEGTSMYSVGDDLFGQLLDLIAPLGSAGTHA